MGSYMKAPLINFSNLKPKTPTWESVKMEMKEALEKYSFFEATFDDIPHHLRESVFDGIKQAFDLPLQTKQRNTSNRRYAGYLGQISGYPVYESLGIEDATSPEKVDTFTDILWPQHNPTFSKNMHSYAKQLDGLGKIIRRMVLEILGLESYLDEHLDSNYCVIRFQKYNVPPSHETELGLEPHTDKNLLTILMYFNEIHELQVETQDGKWVTIQPSPNSFLVIVGDAFHAWTNGRLHAINHRVIMSGDEARYSIGLFTFPKPGCMVKVPEEMVDEEHPLLFKPYENCQFYDFVYSNSLQNVQVTLKDFCGA